MRSEEVKLNLANPPSAPHALLFEVAPGKVSSSIPSLVPWLLPSISHTFLHFSMRPPPPLAPSPIASGSAKARMLQWDAAAGIAGRDAAPAPCDAAVPLHPLSSSGRGPDIGFSMVIMRWQVLR